MRFRKRYIVIIFILLPVFVYLLGPKVDPGDLDSGKKDLNLNGADLDAWVQNRESNVNGVIKDGNQAEIVWLDDSTRSKTPKVLLYLHGYSASRGEGDPVHVNFAKRYGMNLYMARLKDHGLSSEDAFKNLTAESYMTSAWDALAVAKQLGDSIIIMSTSTGSTMGLYLATKEPRIQSLIMYSPNIELTNSLTVLLTKPWGLQIGRIVAGGESVVFPAIDSYDSLFWTKTYRIEGLIALRSLMDQTMNNTVFGNVKQPVFLGYYYKSEEEQDPVVSVKAMLEMYQNLGTNHEKKRKVAFPQAGRHVIASKYKSNDWETVQEETFVFAEEVLKLLPQH